MEASEEKTTRKKFLLWSVAVLGSASISKLVTNEKQKVDERATVKMLTQDGTLVEINQTLMTQCGGKISNAELQQWVKKSAKTHE